MKILLPVDGCAHSDRAVHHVVALTQGCADHQIHVINVQSPVDAPEIRSHMRIDEIEAMQQARGGDALASARALLDAAGIAYTPAVVLGPVAKSIADFAQKNGCDQIVMGTRGLGAIGSMLMGSVTTELMSITALPVTLVK